jgi:hypothetical protein
MGGATSREEFIGKFDDIAEELVRTATLTATSARGASTELCQIQGKSLSVLVDGGLTPVLPARSSGIRIAFPLAVIAAVVMLVSTIGALLFILTRNRGSARKATTMLLGVAWLLFAAPAEAAPLVNHSDLCLS